MKASILVAISSSLIVAGCGLRTNTSGVMPLGPDTFTISADDLNPSTAKQAALSQAHQHCLNNGRELLVINTNSLKRGERNYYDVNFRCLNKGDPDLSRPSYTQSPDVVIEQR